MIQTYKILLDFLRQKKKRRKAKQADECVAIIIEYCTVF